MTYILSANFARRHLNGGQKAIVAARVYKVNRREVAAVAGVNVRTVNEAVEILEYAPDEADAVLADKTPFSKALATARENRDASLSEADRHELG